MTWVLLLLIGIVSVRWVLRWLSKPSYYRGQRSSEIPRFTEMLMSSGGHGGVLLIEHEGSEKFLQFVKRGSERHARYIHFGFPDAPWSRAYFDPLRAELEEEGFKTAEASATGPIVKRFLILDMLDPSSAARVAGVAERVMGLEGESYTIHYSGPSPSWSEVGEIWSDAIAKHRERRGRTDDTEVG